MDYRFCALDMNNTYIIKWSNYFVLNQIGYNAEFVKNIKIPVEKCLGAIKFSNQAQFNSRKYTVELYDRISKMGGKIFEDSKVVKIEQYNSLYKISTEEHEVICDKVVICTHYPNNDFWNKSC